MKLVSSDANQTPVRVTPKVFADVPSAQELSSARRARSSLLLLVVLLLGALVATIAFVFVERAGRQELVTAREDAVEELDRTRQELAKREADYESLQREFAPYLRISGLDRQASTLREEIRTKIAQPAYADAKTRTGLRNEWAAFEGKLPALVSALPWKEQVEANLDQQVKLMADLQQKIEDLPPRQIPQGRPACTDPRGC